MYKKAYDIASMAEKKKWRRNIHVCHVILVTASASKLNRFYQTFQEICNDIESKDGGLDTF